MKEHFLLVQTCHLPQFLYVAERFRDKYPGCRLDALALDHPQVRLYLERFPKFDNVFFFKPGVDLEVPDPAARVVMPLLSRGYRKLKRAAASLGGQVWESNYEADLRPVTRFRLLWSQVKAIHSPSPGFHRFVADFPHRPLGRKVLLLESGSPEIVAQNQAAWQSLAGVPIEVTRIPGGSQFRNTWKRLRGDSFDSAVVFFTGERGYMGLKALPFLLPLPQILVVNENGDHFYADARSLFAFLLKRLRYGRNLPSLSRQRLLIIQTEGAEVIGKAIQMMKGPPVTRGGPLAVFCSELDRQYFEGLPDVQRVLAYKPQALRHSLPILLEVLRLRTDVVAAVFSRRPIFRLQKLFFFLIPARHRLVFNENLDCFYLRPGNSLTLFSRSPEFAGATPLRMLLKFLLFGPRFLFLVIWVTAIKLRRAYTFDSGK
jgi:hypothetical protein